LRPEVESVDRHFKRDRDDLPGVDFPLWHVRPRKERQDRSGSTDVVAEVQVIRTRIVEVEGELHQAQSDHLRVEVERPLRVARDRCDVVNTRDPVPGHTHSSYRYRAATNGTCGSSRISMTRRVVGSSDARRRIYWTTVWDSNATSASRHSRSRPIVATAIGMSFSTNLTLASCASSEPSICTRSHRSA